MNLRRDLEKTNELAACWRVGEGQEVGWMCARSGALGVVSASQACL